MRVLLANPRGFCAGVNMAISSLEKTIELVGTPVYVYHEIVHNQHVVNRFRGKGVVFVDSVEEVPEGATLLFSAHGISPEVRQTAARRNLRAIDATCPLVTKVHLEAIKFAKAGYKIVLIGHEGHDEVIGTLGEAPDCMILVEDEAGVAALKLPSDAKLAYLTQTTLSVDDAERIIRALKAKFPNIVGPAKEDICYATTNRQEAVKQLVAEVDVLLVLGSQNSSNSQRLREIGAELGKRAHLIDGVHEIRDEWFQPNDVVLVTAGASAPEEVVQDCLRHLQDRFGAVIEDHVIREEDVHFPMPKSLRVLATSA
jgi:4-hydroxy-3-methylbut-2-en-1-yl diphosphate reductase